MQTTERTAGQMFLSVGMHDVAAHAPPRLDALQTYIEEGRAWVAELGGQVVGYALADVVDQHGHVEQVSVNPAYGRRGIGRRLIEQVVAWARVRRFSVLTLLTFRDVAWNGPYYERLGFRVMRDDELEPELRALRDHEREIGLDLTQRQAMRLELVGEGE